MEELFALSFEKRGRVFVQEEVEEYVPYLVPGTSSRSVVCDHREEKRVPCYGLSALPQSFHVRVGGGLTQDCWFDITTGEIQLTAIWKNNPLGSRITMWCTMVGSLSCLWL